MDVIEAIGNTPLIELKKVSRGLPNPVFIKCEHLNPGGSVKDRTARAIILDAEARGVLAPGSGQTIIEGTAGNTGMGLALIAGARGYRCICVIPERVAVDKRVALRQLGAEVYHREGRAASRARTTSATSPRGSPRRTAGSRRTSSTTRRTSTRTTAARLLGDRPGDPRADAAADDRRVRQRRGHRRHDHRRRHVPQGAAARREDRDGRSDRLGPRRVGQHRQLGPDGPYTVEGIGSASVPTQPAPRRRSTGPRRSPTPRRSRWSSASSRKRA